MPSAAENHMCVKCDEKLNKQVKILTSQYIGTCKSAYTKGYALNWALTNDMDNTISKIDYNDPMTFFDIEKVMGKVISKELKCNTLK